MCVDILNSHEIDSHHESKIRISDLSTIPEESTLFSQAQVESRQSLNSEDVNESDEIDEAQTSPVRATPVNRAESPLPPLIIEVMPNKHDEPEEYYEKLLIKMKKVYKKMLESKDNINQELNSTIDEISAVNEDSFSVNSNTYNADHESSAGSEENPGNGSQDRTIDVAEHETGVTSNEPQLNQMDNDPDIQVGVYELPRIQPTPAHLETLWEVTEPEYSQITFEADVHVDGEPLPIVRPSPFYEEPQIEIAQIAPGSQSPRSPILISRHQCRRLNQALINREAVSEDNQADVAGIDTEASHCEEVNKSKETAAFLRFHGLGGQPEYSQITFEADVHVDGEPLPKVRPNPVYEEPQIEMTQIAPGSQSPRSPILISRHQCRRLNQAFINRDAVSEDNQEPEHSQITFEADVHVDGEPLPKVRPSPVYEEPQIEIAQIAPGSQSPISPILISRHQCRRLNQAFINRDAVSEDNQEPEHSQITFEADVHVDGEPLPKVRPSPVYEEPQIEIAQIAPGSQSPISPILISRHQCRRLNQAFINRDAVSEDNQEPEHSQITFEADVHVDGEPLPKVRPSPFYEEPQIEIARIAPGSQSPRSPILISRHQCRRLNQAFINRDAVSEDNQEPEHSQITFEADVHVDGEPLPKVRPSPFYEEPQIEIAQIAPGSQSPRSPILISRHQCRRLNQAFINRDAVSEDNQEPEHSQITFEADVHVDGEPLPKVRPSPVYEEPQIEIAQIAPGSQSPRSPILISRHQCRRLNQAFINRDAVSEDNKGSETTSAELNTENISRKRRFQHKAVQTKEVSWDNLRANFFVGTPKVFKLCSCVDDSCRCRIGN